MSENTTEAKAFGIDARDVLAKYEEACEEAHRVYNAALEEINRPLKDAKKALQALPLSGDTVYGLTCLVESLVTPTQRDVRAAARQVHELAKSQARQARDEALGEDPFTKFVAGHITDVYGSSYADCFYEVMPATFDQLRELAERKSWCSDFERVMREAVLQGALPNDTVEVVRSVDWSGVPARYEAVMGEEWEMVMQIPAFFRQRDYDGKDRPTHTLRDWAVGAVEFRKKQSPSQD